MLQTITYLGETNSSGVGALGFSGQAFLIQLITFIIVFLILRRYAFKPILKVLQERRDTIEQGVTIGEQMKKEKAELEKQITEQLTSARKEADQIVSGAHEQARDTVREAEEKAKTKADAIVADAKDRIQHETVQARRKLEGELAGLVAEATEAVVGEKVDAKKDAALIDRALKEQANA